MIQPMTIRNRYNIKQHQKLKEHPMPLKTSAANRKDISTAQHGVTLEHRHFAFIASVIADLVDTNDQPLCKDEVRDAFAQACSLTNPKFNRARFYAATRPTSEA